MNKHFAPTRPVAGLAIALAALVLTGQQAAHAQTAASASAKVTGLAYHLVDLDPTDGIAPSVSFWTRDKPQTPGRADFFVRTMYSKSVEPDVLQNAGVLFSGGTNSASNAGGNQTASRSGGDYATSVTTSVANLTQPAVLVSAPGPYQNNELLYYGAVDVSTTLTSGSDGYNTVYWTLSPNTKLVIDGTAELHADSDIAPLAGTAAADLLTQPDHTLGLSVGANVSVALRIYDGTFRRSVYNGRVYDYGYLGRDAGYGNDPRPRDLLEAFSVEMANAAGSELTGQLDFSLNSSVSMLLSRPVPEPGTWLLMGLGLVALTGLAHRRKAT